MIFTIQFAVVLAVGGVLIGFSGWHRLLWVSGSALVSTALVLALADWLHLRRLKLEVTRICEDKLSLGAENPVCLQLRNPSYSPIRGAIRDEYPDDCEATGNVAPVRLPARSEIDVTYHVKPARRGDYAFGDVYARFYGPLRMAVRQVKYPAARHVKVYPNLLDIRKYETALRRERSLQPGQRSSRIRGRGTDFESLRDYIPDDEFRAIDWKASARRHKLVSRHYQEEKSQNVLIALDCGRIMGPVIDGLSRLDHSVNAAMMLAYAAARKGDKVGLIAFGEDVLAFSPPKAGKAQTLNLLKAAYNLQEAAGDTDYNRAVPYLARRWNRRSLILFFTDLVDAESSRSLITQVGSLARKHLCLCVVMSDPAVIEAATRVPQSPEDVFTAAAARQALRARRQAVAQLVRSGVNVLDVPPEEFTPGVVNEYLNIKARARL